LDDPRISCRKNASKSGCLAPDVRWTEVGVVECIEQFASELEEPILIEMNILRDRKIEIRQTWAAHDSHARISEGLRNGTRNCKRICVEPPLHGSVRSREFRIADEVRPANPITAQIQNGASTESRRQWQSGLNYMDSRQLPIAEQ